MKFKVGDKVIVKSMVNKSMNENAVIEWIFKQGKGNLDVRIISTNSMHVFLPNGQGKTDKVTGKQDPWYVERLEDES